MIWECVSSSSLHKKTKQLVKQQESQLHSLMTSYVEEVENKQRTGDENPTEVEMDTDGVHKKQQPIEILGDNLDITINPSKMSMQRQKKIFHWFLVLMKEKQIKGPI